MRRSFLHSTIRVLAVAGTVVLAVCAVFILWFYLTYCGGHHNPFC